MFKLLVTGSRQDPDLLMQERIKYAFGMVKYRLSLKDGLLIHGDATGVDTFAASVWRSFGNGFLCKEFPYPSHLGKAGGPVRNQSMVIFGADLCLAFPSKGSSGTYDCFNKARQAAIPSFLLNSYGNMVIFENYLLAKARVL